MIYKVLAEIADTSNKVKPSKSDTRFQGITELECNGEYFQKRKIKQRNAARCHIFFKSNFNVSTLLVFITVLLLYSYVHVYT